jgi:anti-sigma factor RsiW
MHLSDELLNEYLDQALTPEARAEAEPHLAACADCAARLAALRGLFAEIESLPELTLPRSLAAPVTRRVSGRAALPRWIRLTATLQAALAVIVLALAAPFLSGLVASLTVRYTPLSLAELLLHLQTQSTALLALLPEFVPPQLPAISLGLSSLALTLTAISAFFFWIIGNGLLLKRTVHRSSNS